MATHLRAQTANLARSDRRQAPSGRRSATVERRAASAMLLMVAALGLIIVAFNRALLPAYYFNDDATLRQYMASEPRVTTHNSFETAAAIFDFLGLHDASAAVGFITYFLLLVGVAAAYKTVAAKRLTLVQLSIFGFTILMGSVYLGQLSKEPFVLVVVLAFMLMCRTAIGEILWGFIFVLPLAIYMRPYWAVVGAFYILFRLWFRRERSARHLAYVAIVGLFGLAIGAHLVLGKVSVVSFRTEVQQDLSNVYGAANSTIRDYLPVTGFGYGWPDGVLSAVLLIIPVPLLVLGGLQYLITGLLVSGLWTRFLLVARSFSGRYRGMPKVSKCSLFLVLAFVSVQAVFEPDYGSYLRHLTDLMPVFLVVIGTNAIGDSSSEDDEVVASGALRRLKRPARAQSAGLPSSRPPLGWPSGAGGKNCDPGVTACHSVARRPRPGRSKVLAVADVGDMNRCDQQ